MGSFMTTLTVPEKLKLIYEGKAKRLYETNQVDKVLIEFKDDLTAFNGKKHDVIASKGILNAAISAKLFTILEKNGIATHFIEQVDERTILAKRLKMIPLEVVCRNIAYGSLIKRVPLFKPGQKLNRPIIEFFLKNDELGDPFLSEEHIISLEIVREDELNEIKRITRRVNDVLKDFLARVGITLVDFKLEYGWDLNGDLILGDELTGDTMRLWDSKTGRILDKDLYRKGEPLSEVLKAYKECYRRIVLEEVP
mgnify:CR=1 FL=1